MNKIIKTLADALLPLQHAPQGPGWNHEELHGLTLPGPPIPAAVLLALHDGADGPQLLFTRRNAQLSQHAGQVSFPGGRVDATDADVLAAALREADEEIALPPECVQALGYLDCLDTISGYCVTPVVGVIHGEPAMCPQPDEVAEMFSVPLHTLLDPGRYRQRQIDTPLGKRSVSEIHYQGHVIWGATALILINLQRRMGIVQ